MAEDGIRVELDDNVLESLALLISGDEATPYYRTGYEIPKFFRAAGWHDVGELDGYRRAWTLDRLRERRHDPEALRSVLLRLADPREYLDEDEARAAVVEELNRLLAVEGYHVSYERGRPVLIEQEPMMSRLAMKAPVELTASLTDIVSEPVFGQQLKARLDEAYVCWKAGAPTAAIIMLGSVLEGVLYDVALSRHEVGRKPNDHLETLIGMALDKKWIAREVAEYADVLRGHRNLVHPKKQWTQSYAPEDDVVHIAWNVVVAALNDLAALPRASGGSLG